MKAGQLYTIKDSTLAGVIEHIDALEVVFKRLDGTRVTLGRDGVEESIKTGHIILGNSKNDPNMMFKLRKNNDVHS